MPQISALFCAVLRMRCFALFLCCSALQVIMGMYYKLPCSLDHHIILQYTATKFTLHMPLPNNNKHNKTFNKSSHGFYHFNIQPIFMFVIRDIDYFFTIILCSKYSFDPVFIAKGM